jgi:predicted  nucleic acid-binding Zn-ribbon protein
MPPVKTVASGTDVDNEATAELPVLDVAAYEASLTDPIANTDTWNIPAGSLAAPARADATAQMPAIAADAIPTLRAADEGADLSGTHEMPAMPRPNKVLKATPVAVTNPEATPAPVPSPGMRLPPSPPLIEELRGALAAAERRIAELNEWARIADAERSVAVARAAAENAQLREQLARHLETLHTAHARLGTQSADQPQLEDELFVRADRIETLNKELALRAAELTSVRAMLTATEQRESRLESDVTNLRTALDRREQQIAALTADLAARQEREVLLTSRLSHAVADSDPHVPALRAELAERAEQVRTLTAELSAIRGAAADRNADLEVAEENIRNLEIEVRDKTGKLEEATVTVEEWRAVIAESQRSILQRDSRIQQLEADLEKKLSSTLDSAAQTGEEVALEGPARVLIRTDGNTDFVHVLGRRTRIGRGSDNELVLDTKHVSRYHAVLLAGPVHTSIEDLNSTNGVFVNGKRVARHVLKDGDRVTIGKTHYRFSVRS